MPLYWYTDKPIGKYRLKKPIPVSIIYNYDCTSMDMFGLEFWGANEDEDIKRIGRSLEGDFPPISISPEDKIQFASRLKEYLEEIPSNNIEDMKELDEPWEGK